MAEGKLLPPKCPLCARPYSRYSKLSQFQVVGTGTWQGLQTFLPAVHLAAEAGDTIE